MEIENMHPFCLPFSLCHDATSSSFIDDSTTSAMNSLEGQIGADEMKLASNLIISGAQQEEFDVFDLEIKIEDELEHLGDNDDQFRLHFGDNSSDKRQDEDWFHMPPDEHFHLLSPPAPISSIDTKSSPTLAQLNLNSSDDPVDSLWDSATSGTTLGRSNTPRSSAAAAATTTTIATTTTSTLISPSVQRHRSIQNQHHHLSTLSPVSSDLLSSQSPSHTFTHLYHQRQPSSTHHQGHQHQFHPEPHQFQTAAAATLARPILQRCQSPAPLVTSSCSPLSTTGAALENNNNNNKLKENIDYLTVLLCNGSKKLDTKSASNQQHQPQQSGISSSMAKSYSVLAQSLSTGPKLLERYQMETPQAPGEPSQKPAQFVGQATGNFEKVDSSVSAADSTGENHHNQQQQQHSHLNQHHQLNANQSASQQQQANYSNFCYANTTTTTSQQQQIDSRANEMKVLSSLLSSGKTLASQMYGQTQMLHTAIIEQSAAGAAPPGANCANWPQPNAAAAATLHHAIGGQQVPMRPIEGGPYQAREPASASCLGQQSQQQVYAQQQVSSSIPINGRPITLTPLVSNNVNIGSRPTPLASVPTLAAKGRSSGGAGASPAGPTFVQPNSPSTSSTTSSSDTSIQPTAAATAAANKRQKAANNQMAPQAAAAATAAAAAAASRQTTGSDRTGRPSSMSTDGSLSSHDEGFSSQVDQDDCADSMRGDSDDDGSELDSDDESFYGDYTNNDLIGASISDNPECKWTLNMGRTRRNGQRRFFWQYNVQSKGPKGARVCSAEGGENPFVLPEASDPVFSDECQIEGVKHSGKARRGDGNDLTPNPRKLLMIGLELKKLSKIINELAPVTDMPVNARNKTRKEKNKLASRACRLKKKAQHEANKIKLYGLQREHRQVVMAIFDARKLIHKSLVAGGADQRTGLGSNLRRLLDQCIVTVAGQTGDYVNSVLEKVVSGCIDGGLQT